MSKVLNTKKGKQFIIFGIFFLVGIFMISFVSAEYATSLEIFDSENDSEIQSQSNDVQVNAGETTTFYANYSSDDGYDIGEVVWTNGADLGSGYAVCALDLDGDGNKTDFAYNENDEIYVYYENRTLAWHVYNVNFDIAYWMGCGDFNNDTNPEIIFLSSGGYLSFINGINGSVIYQSGDLGSGYAADYGDFDGDGLKDDFAFGTGGDLRVWGFNETSGNLENWWTGTEPTYTYEIDVSEIVGEETLIAVTGYAQGRVIVYYGNGTLKYQTSDQGTTYGLTFFDQDGDGEEDEIALGESGELRVFDEDGNLIYTNTEVIGSYDYEVEAIDLDGDGIRDDVLVSDYYSTLWAYNSGSSLAWKFQPRKEFENVYQEGYTFATEVVDLNNDSIPEIIFDAKNHNMFILNISGDVIGKHRHSNYHNFNEQDDRVGYLYTDDGMIVLLNDTTGDGLPEFVYTIGGYLYIQQEVGCKITINGTVQSMLYNYTSKLWEYPHYFDDSLFDRTGEDNNTFAWSVTCQKGGYETKTNSSNIIVYAQNTSLDIFDQEDDSEDNAGWLSEGVVVVDEDTYFFANFSDVETSLPINNIGFDVEWFTDIGSNIFDAAAMDFDSDGISEGFVYSEDADLFAFNIAGSLLWSRYDVDMRYIRDINTFDYDNDSDMEILFGAGDGYDASLFVIDSTGKEEYQSEYMDDQCYTTAIGDLDGDGREDDVVMDCEGPVYLTEDYVIMAFIYNDTSGSFENYWNDTTLVGRAYEIIIQEIEGGENLVAFSDSDSTATARVFYANGTPYWDTSDLGDYVYAIEFIDYDDDGDSDELVIAENGDIFVYNESGQMATNSSPLGMPQELEVFDYNNDGEEDEVILFERNYLRAFDSSLNEVWNYPMYDNYYASMQIIDLNNDGEKEIIIAGYDSNLWIFNRTGSLIYKYSLFFPDTMEVNEYSRFGDSGTMEGAGMDFTEFNNKYYLGFSLNNAGVGVAEVFPRCIINFNDSTSARMYYNSSAGLYYYNRSFSSSGAYEWNVSCESENSVIRTSRDIININTAPILISSSNTPSSADDLDPNVTIVVTANVSDINGNFDSAILQWKNSTAAWANVSMINTTVKGLYTLVNASFTPLYTVEDNYTYRFWMNDTGGESGFSDNSTIEVVWDCSWTSTSNLDSVNGWDENKFIGNLIINNTGDSEYSDSSCSLDFRLNYNLEEGRIYYDHKYYKPSSIYTISAGSISNITLNASFLSEVQEENVLITTSEVSSRSSTSTRDTSILLLNNQVGPYLFQLVTVNPSSVSLTEGNFSLKGYVKNLMGAETVNTSNTAYNVTFNWTLVSGLEVLSGNLSINYTNITDSDFHYSNLSVGFSDLASFSPGVNVFYLYAQGYNISGGLIKDGSGNTLLTEQVNISFLCYNVSDGICVTSCGYTQDSDCEQEVVTVVTPSSDSGGGGGGGSASALNERSDAYFELLSGDVQEFQLSIENKWNSTKKDLIITVEGIDSKYIDFISTISEIKPHSSKNLNIKINTPAYFTKGEFKLIFQIKGKLISDTSEDFSETKVVTLYIIEVLRKDADNMMNQAIKMIQEMNSSEMILDDVLLLQKDMVQYYNETNFLDVQNSYEELKKIYDAAIDSLDIINELEKGVKNAELAGIKVIETKKMLYLAEAAFRRGDYLLALEKLRSAKMTYALETKGEFNLYYIIKNHPSQSLLALLGLGIFSMGSSFVVRLKIYKRKLKSLREEEKILLELMKVIQKETFENNKMSMEEYTSAMDQYEERLGKAVEDKIKYETRISNLLRLRGKKKALEQEKSRLIESVRDLQDRYLNKATIETRLYGSMIKSYTKKISEIEGELTVLETNRAFKGKKTFDEKGDVKVNVKVNAGEQGKKKPVKKFREKKEVRK